MSEYSHILGDVVKQAREKCGLTQIEVANMIGIDSRTVLNIENYKGNPKMQVLYPLIRALKIDAREIFNPELRRESSARHQLRILIDTCSDQEIENLLKVYEPIVSVLRSKNAEQII